ncbi:hypothetical protein SCMU_04470 [Sinomonas cyclohexanicum]|uniref:Uncharacterized protein n=1 Tax=Sinomonas cyclohexanicum TaxID=322009 RepID=A0ABM7PRB9_SINCY|nr:hypothetical protein SCMU_04470 [Corynebacterium cyclohexanicum]
MSRAAGTGLCKASSPAAPMDTPAETAALAAFRSSGSRPCADPDSPVPDVIPAPVRARPVPVTAALAPC